MANDIYGHEIPRKRSAAGALFRNANGELLIVKPTYRDDWLIPGGSIDVDESPFSACVREVEEEIGIKPPIGRPLCIEYQAGHGKMTESYQFIFDGGILDVELTTRIVLQAEEIAAWQWSSVDEAIGLLAPKLGPRISVALTALREDSTIYMEDKAIIESL